MAGRGRRLGGYGEKEGPLRRPGEAAVSQTTAGNINISVLIRKINEIKPFNIDPLLLHDIEIMLKQLFVTGDAVKDILSSLHGQALNDSDFGEKLVIALEQVWTFEVDNICVKTQWFTYVQDDYLAKDTLIKSDIRKFANVVLLLGDMFNVYKILGKPITILGCALLGYIDLLVESKEENLQQVLATQLILNGNQMMMLDGAAKHLDTLKLNLRKTLMNVNMSNKGKCWVLLSLDYVTNNFTPLHGVVREFYAENLKDDYLNLEARSKGTSPVKGGGKMKPSSKSESLKSIKADEISQEVENLNISNSAGRGIRSGIKSNKSEQEINLRRSKGMDESKGRQKKQGSEIKISTNRSKSPKSDDDFYGIQIDKKQVPEKKNEA